MFRIRRDSYVGREWAWEMRVAGRAITKMSLLGSLYNGHSYPFTQMSKNVSFDALFKNVLCRVYY